jgi:hypothetical protein
MAGRPDSFGFENYRRGGLERIGDASLLLRAGQFAGAIYLAGRGVEALLRAMVWKADPEVQRGSRSLDTGHDLRALLSLVADLGLLVRVSDRDHLENRVQRVSRLWYNNLRFAPSKFIETRWLGLGEFGKHRRYKTFKAAASAYFDDCSAIVKRCEVLCEKSK